jgi:hypothetical protein
VQVSQIRGSYRPLCYVREHELGDELSGDVPHVFHTSIIGDDRFIDSFPNAEEWWFYAALATRSKMFALDPPATTVEYLDDGLTIRQPNKEQGAEIGREPSTTKAERGFRPTRDDLRLRADSFIVVFVFFFRDRR